jgi:hypothetical protein
MSYPTPELPNSGFTPDPKVAKRFGVVLATLANWDESEKMKALGWELPVWIEDRKYRRNGMLDTFERNLLEASIHRVALVPKSRGGRKPRRRAPAAAASG